MNRCDSQRLVLCSFFWGGWGGRTRPHQPHFRKGCPQLYSYHDNFPDLEFVGGGEESFGYMVGDAVRDKDAVAATLLICEVAALAKAKGSSVYKELLQHYVDFGFYKEHLISLTKKGMDGLAEINQMMIDLRENLIKEINNPKVFKSKCFNWCKSLRCTFDIKCLPAN